MKTYGRVHREALLQLLAGINSFCEQSSAFSRGATNESFRFSVNESLYRSTTNKVNN